MKATDNRNLAVALAYAELGWSVFPCHSIADGRCTCRRDCSSPGKHPITQRGFLDASKEISVLEAWWTQYPWANVAIATGSPSGVFVLDIDPRNGGHAGLAALVAAHGELPRTVTADTGGGGYHLFFRSKNGSTPTHSLAPGVDMRGEGAYVVAPYSKHKSGRFYLWREGLTPHAVPLAEPPTWLTEPAEQAPLEPGSKVAPPDFYPAGERNHRLFRDAAAMRRRGFDAEAIFQALKVQNQAKCSPPLPESELRALAFNVERRYAPGLGPGEEITVRVERPAVQPAEGPVTALGLSQVLSEPYTPPEWLIPEWLSTGPQCTILAGEWGSAKSLVALHTALNLARFQSRTFLNYLDIGSKPLRVMYIDQENPKPIAKRRIQRLSKAMYLSPEEAGSMAFFYLHDQFLNPDTQRGKTRLLQAIESFEPDFVVLDSLARHHSRDENSNSEMGQYYNDVIKPLLSRFQLAILILQNMRKGRHDQQGREVPLTERVRGASGIMDFVDNGWAIDKGSIEARALHLIKNREGTNPRPINIFLEDSEDESALTLTASPTQVTTEDEGWTLLSDQGQAGLLRSALVVHLEQKGIAHETAKKAVSRLLTRWRKQGKIRTRPERIGSQEHLRVWLSVHAPADAE